MLPQTFLIRMHYHLLHHICHLYMLRVDCILHQQKLHFFGLLKLLADCNCCVCNMEHFSTIVAEFLFIMIELHEIGKRKANWIGHILRRNCLLKQVTEGKIKGEIEVTRRRGRRRRSYWMTLRTGEDTII